MQKTTSIQIALIAGLATLPLSFAAPHGKRLIETEPGVQFWATPAEMAKLSEKSHLEGKCGGFMDVTDYPMDGPEAFVPSLALADRNPTQQAKVTPLLKQVDEGNLIALVTKLSAFDNRDYNSDIGVDASNHIKSLYEKIGAGRSDIRVDQVKHKFKQPSVIATIDGSGPQKNEIIVIGGHIDSISSGAKAPGADDNASGSATVLEAFRILVDSGIRPNRTIQFMGYAGEERGLLGSQDIASQYRQAGKAVAAVLQFDMTMYPGATPTITFISDYTNKDLTKFVQKLSDEYVKANWKEDKCGYACSDHASWTKAGYPSAFPFESAFNSYNPNIHSAKDTLDKLQPGHGTLYLKLAIAFAVELAEDDGKTSEPTPPGPTPPAPTPPTPKPTGNSGSSWPGVI